MKDKLHKPCPVCSNSNDARLLYLADAKKVRRFRCLDCDCIYFGDEPPYNPTYDLAYNMEFFRPGDIQKAGIMAKVISEILEVHFKDPLILEIGTGNGLTVFNLMLLGYRVWGLDLDPNLVSYLNHKLRISVMAKDFLDYKSDVKWDFLYSSHVIEHFPDPWKFMDKAWEILKPGGLLLLECPNTDFYAHTEGQWHHFDTRDPYEHQTLLSTKAVETLIRKSDFDLLLLDSFQQYQSLRALMKKPY